jgi:hypothetical protein
MGDFTGTNHIQVDIGDATVQMVVGFNCCGMIAIFPESTFAILPQIELLGGSAGYQLQALRNGFLTAIQHQQVDVIGGDNVIENLEAKTFLGLIQPMLIAAAIMRKFQEEFLLVAAMSYVPDTTRYIVTICSWHA